MPREPDAPAPAPSADRVERWARLLAHQHFDRKQWVGACTKAERLTYVVNEQWQRWAPEARAAIALADAERAAEAQAAFKAGCKWEREMRETAHPSAEALAQVNYAIDTHEMVVGLSMMGDDTADVEATRDTLDAAVRRLAKGADYA